MIEVGRICIKIAGREAGLHCVIVNRIDENFVTVTGPKSATKVKRRRCNVTHLMPLEEKIKIKPDASDEEIMNECQKAGLFSKLQIQLASPEKPGIEISEKDKVKGKAVAE